MKEFFFFLTFPKQNDLSENGCNTSYINPGNSIPPQQLFLIASNFSFLVSHF